MGVLRRARFLLVALALPVLAELSACGSGDSERPPDVIVVVMDTVRRDFMGFAGHARPTTPRLDAFAAISTEFPRAKATSPWTLPSHASLFTGLYPFQHGARGYWDPTLTVEKARRATNRGNVRGLGEGVPTLAEWFRARGYATGAVVANDVFLGERYGVQRGFDHYDLGLERAPRINERALAWLDAQPSEQPVFLFLNYMDAHKPYNVEPVERLGPAPDYDKTMVRRVMEQVHGEDPALDPAELAHIVHWYELGIANLDAAIGQLFDALRARGRFEPAVLLVTSDHGEYFGEHALFGHSKDVYEEALAIPMLLKRPGQAQAARDDRLLSLSHVPSLLTAELPATGEPLPFPAADEGEILGELYGSRMKDLREPWGARFLRVRMAHYQGPWKLIYSSDGQHELFRLDEQGEGVNLIATSPGRVTRSQLALRDFLERGAKAITNPPAESLSDDETQLSPEEVERLKSLGYQ